MRGKVSSTHRRAPKAVTTSAISSIAGLAVLWFAARRLTVPDLRTADVTPMMNFATVRMTGEVTGKPYTRRDGDSIAYAAFSMKDA